LESLKRVLAKLEAALAAHGADPGNEVIGMAVIKAYEFSFELSWKTLKDLLAYGGIDALLPGRYCGRLLIAAPLVYVVGSHKSWLVTREMSGGLFTDVVPDQVALPPEAVKGLLVHEKE
jgi:hypothetical protein